MISSCKCFDLRTKTEKNNSEPRHKRKYVVFNNVGSSNSRMSNIRQNYRLKERNNGNYYLVENELG